MKEHKNWFKREIKPAYKLLKEALKSGDEDRYLNALQWMYATITAAKDNKQYVVLEEVDNNE